MGERTKVIARINGKEYTIVGTESDEYIQRLAMFVDKKMNEITRHNQRLSTGMAAVLTAVNVADEYYRSMKNGVELKEQLKTALAELENIRLDYAALLEENGQLKEKNTELQMELVKNESRMGDVIHVGDRRIKQAR